MSNSVVKVTEAAATDNLILVIGEDGTVTPDKKTVEAYLKSRTGETNIQLMQVNKSDGRNIDINLDTVTYLASHNEEASKTEDMDELQRNLMNFRMDHDYTPFTSPQHTASLEEPTEIEDELAQTLSILEGSHDDHMMVQSASKIQKAPVKTVRRVVQLSNKVQIKPLQNNIVFKQPTKTIIKPKSIKQKLTVAKENDEDDEENFSDEDYMAESDADDDDDANDSDYEVDEASKNKAKKGNRMRTRIVESSLDAQKLPKGGKVIKTISPKQETPPPPLKIEKPPEPVVESKTPEKKPTPKKEKKPPKPIPDDFALFSTPDIIRRVGGKQEPSAAPSTPNTPTTPESPKPKPAKLFQSPLKPTLDRSSSLDSKDKKISGDKQNVQRINEDSKGKDRRYSLDLKRRQSTDMKVDVKERRASYTSSMKTEGQVIVQTFDESATGNSNESLMNVDQLEPIPSAEDIRAIIQNEDTKTFTTSLVIPEPSEESATEQTVDQSQMNLESGGLELDQSILDNINSDLISEDILYQVAQSLVDNPELQNAIDKSLVDGNLVLDPPVQQAVVDDSNITVEQLHNTVNQVPAETPTTSELRGTQIMRSGGRVVIIPPPERPTTRSRNKTAPPELSKIPTKAIKTLTEEHVSGGELDSSSDDDKSDDDPNKLWCICNQPHNNRFMICCDTCEEWYHGKCVNVSKLMGKQMETKGEEWICIFCKDPTKKRPEAAARRVRKASRNSISEPEKPMNEPAVVQPPPVAQTASTTIPGCIVCRKPCRSNSIYCSDPCILRHAEVVEKVVVFERSTGKILSGNSAPSAANLDKWLQQNPGFEVVRSTNANKVITTKPLTQSKLKIVKNITNPGVSLAVQRKGINVSILRHAPKPQIVIQKSIPIKHQVTSVKIIKPSIPGPPRAKLIQPAPLVRNPVIVPAQPKFTKVVQQVLKPTVQPTKDKPIPQKTPKSRQAEDAAPQSNRQDNIRDNIRKTLCEQLVNRLKNADDLKLTREEVTKISSEIESQLYKCFGDTGQKYRNKYRSLIFNIKDIKNQTLWRRICEKSINPYQLVRLSPDDLASQELALWRERENKHQLEMITKSELEQLGRNRQYVFKTHKGEQVLEDSRPTDAVDNTEVITNIPTEGDGSSESTSDHKKDSKERDKKKHSRSDRDRKLSRDREKSDRKERKRDHRSSSRDRSRRHRSRSKEGSRHTEKNRSRSRDRDRHRRSSHKTSRHKKEPHTTTDKLDKKSKEILEQLVDNKIVPPLEDRLWKHVQQEDIPTAFVAESDSDHEPTSTVTIPTPPRTGDIEELSAPTPSIESPELKPDDIEENKPISPEDTTISIVNEDISRSPPLNNIVWKGLINMVDVAQISIVAQEVSGDSTGIGEELPPCLDVVGRISPDTVWEYIGKMKCSNSKAISLLRLNATNDEEKMPYLALYSYLSSRNRLGVVKSNNKGVKDFYILPLASHKPIPQPLLPLNGPGFEESRPSMLLGIIVRDKRKRPLFNSSSSVPNKKSKVETPSTQPIASGRSYTPPPAGDPRLKHLSKAVVQESPKEDLDDDMDEPYSPEDSDPDTLPTTSSVNKASTFLETTLSVQTFEPFTNKFDTIPGLDDTTALPANTQELQRKMEELDQRIAMQKAEIHNMSQDIASSTTSGIGTSALASIALPSNLQQILDSIKGITPNPSESEIIQATKANTSSDLTIPLMLPKLSTRGSSSMSSSPTIPLNLPKYKTKPSTINSPILNSPLAKHNVEMPAKSESDKSTSVLSSLSEEDLIRKAAEMLGETEESVKPASHNTKDSNFSPVSYNPTPLIGNSSLYSTGPIMYNTPPPNMVPPSLMGTSNMGAKLDASQPPIPGLED